MRRVWPASIRGRLLAGVLGLSLLALLVAELAVLLAFRGYLTDRTDGQLRGIYDRIERAVAARGELRVREGQVAALVPANAVVVIRDGERPLVSVGAHGDEVAALTAVSDGPVTVTGAGRELRVLYIPATALRLELAAGVTARASGAVVALDLTDDQDAVRNLAVIEAVVAGVAAVALILLSGTVTRVGLRPLREMADAIASGRSPESPPDNETTTLAVALNRAFDARERAERGLRDFVADASHELRTPLTLIHGWADLYLQGGLPDAAATESAMDRILAETTRMRMLVDELLLLARLDAHQPLIAEPVDLVLVVAEVVADARIVSPDREITLTGATTAAVLGDEMRLRQVVRNLVGNAARHTPPGTAVRVAIAVEDAVVTVRVADDGLGLPADELSRVFERFHRAGRDRAGGSGLGLSIVAAVVNAHGGTVRAEAPAGGGALFVVELPRAGLQETVRFSGG